MMSVRLASQLSICGKNFEVAIFSDVIYKYDKCQTLHDGSTPSALPIHTTFTDLDWTSNSQQRHKFKLNILCSYLVKLKLCTIVDYIQ